MVKFQGIALAFAGYIFAITGAVAQDAAKYPEQLVRVIVPFSAGSMTDLLARVVADKLQQRWNKDVVVENRPGLAGTSSVAKGASDGYTLMLTSNGHTVISHLNKNLAFDPIKDFVGVSQVATTPLILLVPPDSPATAEQCAVRLEVGARARMPRVAAISQRVENAGIDEQRHQRRRAAGFLTDGLRTGAPVRRTEVAGVSSSCGTSVLNNSASCRSAVSA